MNLHRFRSLGYAFFGGVILAVSVTPQAHGQMRTMPAHRGRSSRARQGWTVAGANVGGYAGARFHTRSSVLEDELPFKGGDVAGVVGVEFHESEAYWQFLLGGVRRPGEDEVEVAYALTPEINLILKDRKFLGGAGILRSYFSSDDEDYSGWSRIYYQLLLGLDFSAGDRFSLTVLAHYPFARWKRLRDFKGSDLEYSVGASYRF